MTREEAIKMLRGMKADNLNLNDLYTRDKYEALVMAIKALEQEPVIDKIRAEILEEKECAYANFEAYKIDYLMQDEEDVLDSLPQDDFRYGMERAIEIINKYKRESEGEE